MKIQTFSIVAGTEACNAKCPFCVSKMTPNCGISNKKVELNYRFDQFKNFEHRGQVFKELVRKLV